MHVVVRRHQQAAFQLQPAAVAAVTAEGHELRWWDAAHVWAMLHGGFKQRSVPVRNVTLLHTRCNTAERSAG
jgi:hypothetical protein